MKSVIATLQASFVTATLFLISQAAYAATETILYAFRGGTDGFTPSSSLLHVKGKLYGVTTSGGTGHCNNGCGTVFSIDIKTGVETVLHSFDNDGNDGYQASGGLIVVNGALYGTTSDGGTGTCQFGCGTIYSINLKNGKETIVYSFKNDGKDGRGPSTGLIDANGTLYGTTIVGGANCANYGGCGTAFSVNIATGSESTLYSFCTQANCIDGALPAGPLLNINGILYGTTAYGGTSNTSCVSPLPGCGTLFSVNPDTGSETTLHSFCLQKNCTDGSEPVGGLLSLGQAIYGSTSEGGNDSGCYPSGCGTIFSFDSTSQTESELYIFCERTRINACAKGKQPNGGLTDYKGKLIGATEYGGRGIGNVFSLELSRTRVNLLYSFIGGVDGQWPAYGLINVNGIVYGTTEFGGNGKGCNNINGCGTVFAIKP